MRISDWSSDVCSSDLYTHRQKADQREMPRAGDPQGALLAPVHQMPPGPGCMSAALVRLRRAGRDQRHLLQPGGVHLTHHLPDKRSEEHTSELQSLMRISYAVFSLKKKRKYSI